MMKSLISDFRFPIFFLRVYLLHPSDLYFFPNDMIAVNEVSDYESRKSENMNIANGETHIGSLVRRSSPGYMMQHLNTAIH